MRAGVLRRERASDAVGKGVRAGETGEHVDAEREVCDDVVCAAHRGV